MPPRTIDNLGIEAYNRYAQDQEERDEQIVKEAHSIPMQTGIDVSMPSFASESDTLLNSESTKTIWAYFSPPEHFFEQKGRIFSHLLIPSLGSEGKKESVLQKIALKSQSLTDKPLLSQPLNLMHQEPWQKERALGEQEKEKNALTSLFNTVASLDKFLIDINSKRSQYQKG